MRSRVFPFCSRFLARDSTLSHCFGTRAHARQAGEKVKQWIFHSMLTDLTLLQSAAKYEAPDVAKALLEHGVSARLRRSG